MEEKGLPQEGLKVIACLSMLIDHIAAVFGLSMTYRIIGRLAFPIYCFLMAEGVHYTKSPKRYMLRLFVGMLLSELPFDMAFNGGWDWSSNSVMVTLLLGFFALECMKRADDLILKLLMAMPFAAIAELACTDYGGYGVLLIAMFGVVRELPGAPVLRLIGMLIVCGLMRSAHIVLGGMRVSVELFAVLAIIPIECYRGRKGKTDKAVQWAFYLFYPVHLAILAILDRIL